LLVDAGNRLRSSNTNMKSTDENFESTHKLIKSMTLEMRADAMYPLSSCLGCSCAVPIVTGPLGCERVLFGVINFHSYSNRTMFNDITFPESMIYLSPGNAFTDSGKTMGSGR